MSRRELELLDSLSCINPSVERLRENVLRQKLPRRVHYFDLGVADNVQQDVYQYLADARGENSEHPLQRDIAVHQFLGYDIFRLRLKGAEAFPRHIVHGKETLGYDGAISSWSDYEVYKWPTMEQIDFSPLAWYEENLPETMGIFVVVRLWEMVRDLFSFEQFCFKLYDDPELVQAVFEKVGAYYLEFTRRLTQFNCVACILAADDLGFKTSTMLDPQVIRTMILPWHARFAQVAHAADKMYFFHSCGKLDTIMDDMIQCVHADAKHSFEEVIEPVTVAKRRYGDRIALLGGLDVDFLARASEEAIRSKVRQVLDVCMEGGGYCLGSGNWITNYIPLANYLVMLDEGRRWGEYHISRH